MKRLIDVNILLAFIDGQELVIGKSKMPINEATLYSMGLKAVKEKILSLSTETNQDIVAFPTPLEDESFIEQEISFQHHGVVRSAICNYKIWLKERNA